ncbi:hypothetical protein GOBAR_DD33064 [Gossypium barbadense]|nr:hypothetical protein GOBAR_DD33064 [Gossypium barbadense]
MGKKNPLAEIAVIRLNNVLEKFRESEDEVYTFESNLTNKERAVVHKACQKMGMKSKSKGRGSQRCVSVYKIKEKASSMTEKNPTNVSFSEGTQLVLQDLFTYYPPDDGELEEKVFGKYSGKSAKIRRKKDDIFSKPLMNAAEIAKKVKTLASKREKYPNMRQIDEERSKLPISGFRDAITSAVECHQIILISGETGCGKTTQVLRLLMQLKLSLKYSNPLCNNKGLLLLQTESASFWLSNSEALYLVSEMTLKFSSMCSFSNSKSGMDANLLHFVLCYL